MAAGLPETVERANQPVIHHLRATVMGCMAGGPPVKYAMKQRLGGSRPGVVLVKGNDQRVKERRLW
jgi:hypothetical protein